MNGRDRRPTFFGHPMKEHLSGHVCKYAETDRLSRRDKSSWGAYTRIPLPYYDDAHGRTEDEALRNLERKIVREFKRIAKVLGYEVHDG